MPGRVVRAAGRGYKETSRQMNRTTDTPSGYALAPPGRLFPLIRHISWRATSLLVRLPVTPNQVTLASIAAGLGSALCYLQGEQGWQVPGALLLVLCYVLDFCDGEIARLKGMCSDLGARLDTFGDWAVHSALFVALGSGVEGRTGEALWLWLGWAAAAGATINYVIALIRDARQEGEPEAKHVTPVAPVPRGPKDRFVFAFRELARADFCFLLLALTLLDLAWLLLPLAAVGAQLYWMMAFAEGARAYRV